MAINIYLLRLFPKKLAILSIWINAFASTEGLLPNVDNSDFLGVEHLPASFLRQELTASRDVTAHHTYCTDSAIFVDNYSDSSYMCILYFK